MRLLICTQKVDQADPILGFFCDWLTEFAKNCEQVTVICLAKGEFKMPANVRVLSLGKEDYRSKFGYLFLFIKYLWQIRQDYDSVFVHMNTIYVILAGWYWRIINRKIGLWYIHPRVDKYLSLAVFFSNYIFTASLKSFPIKSRKVKILGHGINTQKFKPDPGMVKLGNSLIMVGRITPIKKIDILVKALRILQTENFPVTLHLFGGPDEKCLDYYENFKQQNQDLEEAGLMICHGVIDNNQLSQLYQQFTALVNLTPTGSFDKAILEAAACGTLVITSNQLFKADLPDSLLVEENNPSDLAKKIKLVLAEPENQKNDWSAGLRQMVANKYDLANLIKKIINAYESPT